MSNLNTVFRRIVQWGLVLLVAGCGRADFPFCCDLAGTSDVPVVKTYNFGFRSGYTRLAGPLANLTIATASDLANFEAAANLIPNRVKDPNDPNFGKKFGTISGVMINGAFAPLPGLVLEATDALGNTLSRAPTGELNLFYNGLGGVPDFSNTTGTADTGAFTLFNAPPGQVFLKVVKGGRGNGRVFSFLDSVSFMAATAVLAIPDTIPMTGVVNDIDTTLPITGAAISALGVGPLATSNPGGGYNIPENAGSSTPGPSLKSAGSFYFKASAPGYYDTYQIVSTDPATVQAGTTDLTQFLKLQSRLQLARSIADRPITLDPQKGILIGVLRQSDRTPQEQGQVEVRDIDGTLLAGQNVGDLYYRTASADPTKNRLFVKAVTEDTKTTINGEFIVLNLPPGKVYVTVAATTGTASAGNPDKTSAALEVPIFAGSAFYIDSLTVIANGTDDNNPGFVPSHSQKVSGRIRNLQGVPAGDVAISTLGLSGRMGISDEKGQYLLPAYLDKFQFQPTSQPCTESFIGTNRIRDPVCALITGGNHILRLSNTNGPPDFSEVGFPTYQQIQLGASRTQVAQQIGDVRNLTILTEDELPGNSLAAGTGVVAGTILNLTSGRTPGGISLKVTDDQGNGPIGTVYYVDDQNGLQQSGTSFDNGRFLVANIPIDQAERVVYLTVTSTDDSGAKPVRVIKDSATVLDLVVNKSPAVFSDVRGTVRDLRGNPVPGASGRVLGDKEPFPTDSGGAFSIQLQSAGTYIARLEHGTHLPSENYQIRTGIGNRVFSDLYMTSAQELSELSGGSIVQDPAKGVIAGRLMTSGFLPVSAPDPYNRFSPSFVPPTNPGSVGVITGFFDSDEKVDVAIVGSGSEGGLIQILSAVDQAASSVGEGLFRAVPNPIVGADGAPVGPTDANTFPIGHDLRGVAPSDFNGDGLVDLAVVDHNPETGLPGVLIFLSNGNGTFTQVDNPVFLSDPTQGRIPVGAETLGSGAVAIQALDYNLDNVADLAVLTDQGNVFVLLGAGDGTFNFIDATAFTTAGTGSIDPGASAFAVGDYNADTFPDFAVANTSTNRITVLPNTFLDRPQDYNTDANPFAIGTADFDQDGVLDWAVLCDTPSGYFINLVFSKTDAIRLRVPLPGRPQNLIVFDYDQDGRPDLLLTFPEGVIFPSGKFYGAVYYGDGAGHLSDANPVDLCPAPGCSNQLLGTAPGVFNRDIRVDLVSVASDRVYVALGTNSPLERIRIEATAAVVDGVVDGTKIGQSAYFFKDLGSDELKIKMDQGDPNVATTFSGDGRFVIFNVNPGLTMVRASAGGAGNSYVEVKPGEMVYLEIQTFSSPPETIFAAGGVGDFVGNAIPNAEIRFLGTNLALRSGSSGEYQGFVRAQSDYIVFLDREAQSGAVSANGQPCTPSTCP